MRGSAMNVMHQEYIKYARARGLSDGVIRKKYVGKNARLPMITTLERLLVFYWAVRL